MVLQSSNGGFFHLLSCPRSVFLADMSSSISSLNDLISLTSLCPSSHFDLVSCVQFTFHLLCLNLHLLPYPRANRPPTLTYDSSRGTSDMNLLFFFNFRLCGAACAFFSLLPHYVQIVFSVSGTQFQLHLVLGPFLFFSY
jgi:hypothetical protein